MKIVLTFPELSVHGRRFLRGRSCYHDIVFFGVFIKSKLRESSI